MLLSFLFGVPMAPTCCEFLCPELCQITPYFTAHNKIPQWVPHRIRMNNLTTNRRWLGGRRDLEWTDQVTPFSLCGQNTFSHRKGFLASFCLLRQLSKFLWDLLAFTTLSYTSHPASSLKFTHLIYGFFQCSCWLVNTVFQLLVYLDEWDIIPPFTALDFPCYFCSFTGLLYGFVFDILGPKTARSLLHHRYGCKDGSKYISTHFVLYTNRKLRGEKPLWIILSCWLRLGPHLPQPFQCLSVVLWLLWSYC